MKNISLMKIKRFVTYTEKKCRADKNYTNAFKLYHKVRDLCH